MCHTHISEDIINIISSNKNVEWSPVRHLERKGKWKNCANPILVWRGSVRFGLNFSFMRRLLGHWTPQFNINKWNQNKKREKRRRKKKRKIIRTLTDFRPLGMASHSKRGLSLWYGAWKIVADHSILGNSIRFDSIGIICWRYYFRGAIKWANICCFPHTKFITHPSVWRWTYS